MASIAIVGAGPAGASAGYHLAASGHAVTLVDRAVFPRPKTCGDWITYGAVQALAMMGLYPAELERAAYRYAAIDSSLLGAPNGRTSVIKHSLSAYCIPRDIFDHILYRRAVEAGCAIRTQHIRDLRPGHRGFLDDFEYVIDARGVGGTEPNCVAIRAYWRLRREDIGALHESTVQIYADEAYRMGYGWIFPTHLDRETMQLNVGVGVWIEECRNRKKSVTSYFEKFIKSNPAAQRLAQLALEKTSPRGYPLAVAESGNSVFSDGILKIGDAAKLTDPLTGEGIGNAVFSGFLAALAINTSSDLGQAQRNWQTLYETTFEQDFRAALLLRKLLTGTRAKNAAVWLLNQRPRLAERFHDSLAGISRYSDLLRLFPRR